MEDSWNAWYKQYHHLESIVNLGPAEGFTYSAKYFKNHQMEYIGRAPRVSVFKDKEIINHSFLDFCRATNIPVPRGYRQITPTITAGFKSASKYDQPQPHFDESAWFRAGEMTKEHFAPVMSGSTIMTTQEVIDELDKQTSCGYPHSILYHTKSEFLDSPARHILYDYWDDMLELPQQKIPIWTCTQKRELRSIKKVNEQNHRTFTASPIELTVASNRLCLDMNHKFYDGSDRLWSSVGTTKFLSGWDRLYHRLNKHPNAYELDETNYDASLSARMLYGQRDIRWSLLRSADQTPETWGRLCVLYDQIVHSVIVMENGELVRKHTGNPSGSTNTVVDNTMILFRLFAYAWVKLRPPDTPSTLSYFMTHVEAALYGDDNSFSVSNEVVGWFNPTTIAAIWSEIGVITKTPDEQSRPVANISFLSNGFRYDADLQLWLPCPETDKVLCSLMYGSSLNDIRWHYLRACALRIDSYGDLTCRAVLRDYIAYLDNHYSNELNGSVTKDKVTISMEDIRSVWKSDSWIGALYSGRESEVVDISAQQHLIKLYNHIDNHTNTEDDLTLRFVKASLEFKVKLKHYAEKKQSLVTMTTEKKKAVKVAKAIKHPKRVGKKFKPIYKAPRNVPQPTHYKVSTNTALKMGAKLTVTEESMAATWAQALAKPFKNVPPPIGTAVGSLTFTNAVAYDLTTSSDGSLAAYIVPRGQLAASYNAAITAASNGTWVNGAMTGDAALAGNYSGGRMLAAGIHWKIRIAATSVPGKIYAGLVPDIQALADIQGFAIGGFAGMQCMMPVDGNSTDNYTGEITWRPLDAFDGSFAVSSVVGTTFVTTNVPALAFVGWPAGTNVTLSYIMHVEVVPRVNVFNGIPLSLSYAEHTWAAIYDRVRMAAPHVFDRFINIGARASFDWATGHIANAFTAARTMEHKLTSTPDACTAEYARRRADERIALLLNEERKNDGHDDMVSKATLDECLRDLDTVREKNRQLQSILTLVEEESEAGEVKVGPASAPILQKQSLLQSLMRK